MRSKFSTNGRLSTLNNSGFQICGEGLKHSLFSVIIDDIVVVYHRAQNYIISIIDALS